MIHKYRSWDEDAGCYSYSSEESEHYCWGFENGVLKAWAIVEKTPSDPMEAPFSDTEEIGPIETFADLHDKKGQEIYSRDIYKDAAGIISVVKMAVAGWALFPVQKGTPVRNLYWHNVCNKTNGEVIGNIHEHKKLLDTKTQM
jgi:hypothetical protein